jgi:hypothetical protein
MLQSTPAAVPGIALVVVLSLCPAVLAQSTFVETFDGGSNEGGWTYGTVGEFIASSGGNPGSYLHAPLVDTFAPQPRTTFGAPSLFTGDYRARGVTSVGIDLITFAVDFSAGGRPLSVLLVSDNDTPSDFSDDWAAFHIGPDNIPLVGQGWLSYDFVIPSQAPSIPPGWDFLQYGPNSPPSPDWNEVITDVTQLRFFYGDPTMVFIFQQWTLGLDNPRITSQVNTWDPGRIPPTLTVERVSPAAIRLAWEPSVCPGATDYAVYEGQMGNWESHISVTCSDSLGDLSERILFSPGNRYYLVVPLNDSHEGSYGLDSRLNERPPASPGPCRPSQSLGCP